MNAKVLCLGTDVVTPVLRNIVGQSIQEARVHDELKIVRFTPIYKKTRDRS